MGFFYFDESIHPEGSFSLGAFAYAEESLEDSIADALRQSGLSPRVDEFKSGAWMDRNPQQARTRELLRSVVRDHCRIGVVVAPDRPRQLLGSEALLGLKKILSTNEFRSGLHDIFFDRGIFDSSAASQRAAEVLRTIQPCSLHFEQDSVQVLGLQAADLIAHTCATMLLAELGNSGYDPNLDMELEFELWAGLRYNFFAAGPPPYDTWESQLDFQVDVDSRGLHVAESCDQKVRKAALARFGKMYLGCIHSYISGVGTAIHVPET